MADQSHLALLHLGVGKWNDWRRRLVDFDPDLRGADLSGLDLSGYDLSHANLAEARLVGTLLYNANLSKADLQHATFGPRPGLAGATLRETTLTHVALNGVMLEGADMLGAHLDHSEIREADLSACQLLNATLYHADLRDTRLNSANLRGADLRYADLRGARLERTSLIEAKLQHAQLIGCRVYGASVWGVELEGATQKNLIITSHTEPLVTVDDLEVAQFIHLLMNRSKLRNVINTVGEKAVLILGRFSERRELLDRIAERLRTNNLLPIIFDFERPTDRDLTETVKILAGMSRFVIADITNPSSVPYELRATVPDYKVPFVVIQQSGCAPFSMFRDLPATYTWVLPRLEYDSVDELMDSFEIDVIDAAQHKLQEIRNQQQQMPQARRPSGLRRSTSPDA